MYRDDPRAYWKERGKLVTQLARMEAKYEDAIDKARGLSDVNLINGQPEKRQYRNPATGEVEQVIINPRADAIEQAIVNYSKTEDRIENLARPLDVSLEAVRAHFNEILSGNPDTMPPGEGFPTRFGGYIKRRQLEKNVKKYVPQGPQGRGLKEALLGKDPKFEELHEGQQGDRRLAQVEQAGGGQGPIGTQDREYLKPGQQGPEGVKEHYAERRGADGHQARYYSKREAARVLDEQKNGPDKRDSNLEEDDKEKPFYYSNPTDMTKGGENEMAPTNAPKTPQDPAAEQFQMATENEVAAAKRVSQKSKARSAKANARVASARADEAEVKARRAEEDREIHIGEILQKLDSSISELVVKSDPGVSDVFKQLEQTIDTIEKDISIPIPFRRRRNDKASMAPTSGSAVEDPTTTTGRPTIVFEAPESSGSQTHADRNVAPPTPSNLGDGPAGRIKVKPNALETAGEDEIEGIDKAPNPFAMLGANLSSAFRAADHRKKNKDGNLADTTPTKQPDSPTSTTSQPKTQSLAQQLAPTSTPTTKPTKDTSTTPGAFSRPSTPTTPTKPSTPTSTSASPSSVKPASTTPKSPVGTAAKKLRSTVDIAREKQGMSPRSTTGTSSSGTGGAGGAGGSKPFYYSDKNDLRRKKRRKK